MLAGSLTAIMDSPRRRRAGTVADTDELLGGLLVRVAPRRPGLARCLWPARHPGPDNPRSVPASQMVRDTSLRA